MTDTERLDWLIEHSATVRLYVYGTEGERYYVQTAHVTYPPSDTARGAIDAAKRSEHAARLPR